ncbi:hypothetical protein JCM15579A_04090 [Marinifilum fragile]
MVDVGYDAKISNVLHTVNYELRIRNYELYITNYESFLVLFAIGNYKFLIESAKIFKSLEF